jgi:hypothetical protein
MTPRPAGPTVAPSGSSEAATSVGGAGSSGLAGGTAAGAASPSLSLSSAISWKRTPAASEISFSCTSSEAVSSSFGTALPSTTIWR